MYYAPDIIRYYTTVWYYMMPSQPPPPPLPSGAPALSHGMASSGFIRAISPGRLARLTADPLSLQGGPGLRPGGRSVPAARIDGARAGLGSSAESAGAWGRARLPGRGGG